VPYRPSGALRLAGVEEGVVVVSEPMLETLTGRDAA
jgi:hypothetical protein